MDTKTAVGSLIILAGVGTAGYFGYKFAKEQGLTGVIADGGIVDHNAQVAHHYYDRQAAIYQDQQNLKKLRRR